jgi:hypothetical protein
LDNAKTCDARCLRHNAVWIMVQVRCVNHFARNDEDHIQVGTTSRGTVVRLDKRFVDADIRIATGLVEPHFMAGYSGERTVVPFKTTLPIDLRWLCATVGVAMAFGLDHALAMQEAGK